MSRHFAPAILLTLAVLCTSTSHAENNIVVTASDTGWYDSLGRHTPSNVNYVVGDALRVNTHNFFVFDLSGIDDTIVGATIEAFNGIAPPNSEDGYASPDATETFSLVHVSTTVSTLTNGTGGLAAYNDLADGTLYSTTVVSSADNGQFVQSHFNSAGLADLNSNDGLFAVGGYIMSISHPTNIDERLFWFSHESPSVRIVLTTVPEPSSPIALGAGLVTLACRRRRTRSGTQPPEFGGDLDNPR